MNLFKGAVTVLILPLMAIIFLLYQQRKLEKIVLSLKPLDIDQIQFYLLLSITIIFTSLYLVFRPKKIYLVDFSCYKPSECFRVPFSTFMEHELLMSHLEKTKRVEFQKRILENSGLGEETSLPPAYHYIPPSPTMEASRAEAELVIFSAIDKLLEKTQVSAKNIDILIVNCSLFSPTPSLSAMVVNKYKMHSNIKSFNLSGMGCSAGLLSIDLARELLLLHCNSYALVISTEIITSNYYAGKERSMLLPNCLFRMGAAAILLSNRFHDRRRSKYRLLHLVRTHLGSDDNAYRCVFQEEDKEGFSGVTLSKDLMRIAGKALQSNITTLGPLVLPVPEKFQYLFNMVGRRVFHRRWKPYLPNFKTAFDHFCIHAGGRAVIDALQKELSLSKEHVEASRMTLHRFGNTSSSSLWYELCYIETKKKMKKGDKVWQIAFGSGFKCNSAVWECNRTVDIPFDSPWIACIEKYPVDVPLPPPSSI